MFWRKKRELTKDEIEFDKNDRQVDKYRIFLHMYDGSIVEYETKWRRFNRYANGIISYKELILLDKEFTVKDITYNTAYITKIEHEHIGRNYIKKEVKDYLYTGGWSCDWNWKRIASNDELEEF